MEVQHTNTLKGHGMKIVHQLPDIGSYSTDMSTCVESYYKSVKDLIEKIKTARLRLALINFTYFFLLYLLIFATRYFNSLILR